MSCSLHLFPRFLHSSLAIHALHHAYQLLLFPAIVFYVKIILENIFVALYGGSRPGLKIHFRTLGLPSAFGPLGEKAREVSRIGA